MADPTFPERALIDQHDLGRGVQGRIHARAIDDEGHRQAGAEHRGLLQILEAGDRTTVDRFDHVADFEARQRGRRTRLDEADPRAVLGATKGHK